jgi:membrane-bound lytic murein transglycosylase F
MEKTTRYDKTFIKHSPILGWRTMKTVCASESGLKSKAHSKKGAIGICQMLPSTFRHNLSKADAAYVTVKHSNIHNATHNIIAANNYFSKLNTIWNKVLIPDERRKFILASYNAGENRVIKAKKRCKAATYNSLTQCLPKQTREYVELITLASL